MYATFWLLKSNLTISQPYFNHSALYKYLYLVNNYPKGVDYALRRVMRWVGLFGTSCQFAAPTVYVYSGGGMFSYSTSTHI